MAKPKQKMIQIESLVVEAYFLSPEPLPDTTPRGVTDKPTKPVNGDYWLDKATGAAYVYYHDAAGGKDWVQIGGSGKTP